MVTILERFLRKVEDFPSKNSTCLIYTGHITDDGYGLFRIGNTKVGAHRFAYETFCGEIPNNLQIDHLCRNRACVNPNHLEAVTQQENIKRGLTGKINHRNKRKTHCLNGHEYNLRNTYFRPSGTRICCVCFPASKPNKLAGGAA